jgi:voltage-gated potassium channel
MGSGRILLIEKIFKWIIKKNFGKIVSMNSNKKIFILFFILTGLIIVDVTGYILIENASVFDALYMTIISITTVGFSEIFPLSSMGRKFTLWVILSGLGTFFYIAVTIVESAFEGGLRKILWRRKMKLLLRLKAHVIIAGFGRMGEHVCRELFKKKIHFVIIESNNESFYQAEQKGYNVILGNATDEEALKKAGIKKAKTFIPLLSSDADNIFTTLAARELNPSIFIITRALEAPNEKRLYKIGANKVISPYELSSRRIVNTVVKPNVVDFIDIMVQSSTIALSIEEFTVTKNSPFAQKAIKDSALRTDFNAMVIAIKREQETFFNPSPDLLILPGDILILVGERSRLEELD